jgi:hypothetical protein
MRRQPGLKSDWRKRDQLKIQILRLAATEDLVNTAVHLTSGTSRVVLAGDTFQAVPLYSGSQEVALSAALDATGVFELDQQPQMLGPFEGMGVEAPWELRLPKAPNPLDFGTIADVLLTIEYTALSSEQYRQQVLAELPSVTSSDMPFSFRYNLADAWYDLHNPDLTATPMAVQFSTQRTDFPPNVENLQIQHVQLYFSRAEGETFEIPVTELRFTENGGNGSVGGGAKTVDGLVSTRKGNGGSWSGMIGRPPFGDWRLTLPNRQEVKDWFNEEKIADILLVITFSGGTPVWPV